MFLVSNIDLFSAGLTVAASLILGFIVFYKDRKSATNRLFLLFTLASSGWNVFNYLSYKITDPYWVMWIVRLVMFFAAYQAFLFFLLMHTFPSKKILFSKKTLAILISIIVGVSILTLTPAVFSEVSVIPGNPPEPKPAPGVALFALVAVSSVVWGIVSLLGKIIKATKKERIQFMYLLVGVILMFFLIILFNFVFVTVFGNSSFIPLSALFTLPFVIFTSYSIIKHQLLNIKIISTEILTFALIVTTFIEVLLSSSLGEVFFRVGVFFALLIVGIFLIRSVINEVRQKEKLGELNKRLKELDKQKDEFVSMAAHELRAPMTAIKGYLSMIMQGDTGDIPEKARGYLADANAINERLVRLVNNMLNVSRIEEGRMVYQVETENLSRYVKAVYNQFSPEAGRKSLDYKLEIPSEIRDRVNVDVDRVQEVIANLISNAIKYTDSGSVTVKMSQPAENKVRLEVIDTGPGISSEEQKKLFQKFYRVETNVGKTTGTGLGLYISKLLIDKFGGEMGLTSELGKGSNFWFELPLSES